MAIQGISRIINAPRDLIFDLVADVEIYPKLFPLWRDARVLQRDGDSYVASQEVGNGDTIEQFRSHTSLTRPTHIDVTSEDELFKEFHIRWDFDSVGEKCRVALAITCAMKARSLQPRIDQLLLRSPLSMLLALEDRAAFMLATPGGERSMQIPAGQ